MKNMQNNFKVVKEIATGVQGTASLCRSGNFEFVQKLSNIGSKDLAIPAVRNNLDSGNPEDLLFHTKARGAEFVVEMAAARLASELVEQGICPNFPLLYDVNLVKPKRSIKLETMMELVPGAQTLKDWGREPRTNNQWHSVIFQVLIALHALYSQYGMSHRDLHAKNVLMYKLGEKWKDGYFAYTIEGEKYNVPMFGYMACIIDFGRVNIPGKLHIPWHEHVLRKDMRDLGSKHTYDAAYLLEIVQRFPHIPGGVKKSLSAAQSLLNPQVASKFEIILYILFNSGLSEGQRCDFDKVPCFDLPPANREAPIARFNLDKAAFIPPGKAWEFMVK